MGRHLRKKKPRVEKCNHYTCETLNLSKCGKGGKINVPDIIKTSFIVVLVLAAVLYIVALALK